MLLWEPTGRRLCKVYSICLYGQQSETVDFDSTVAERTSQLKSKTEIMLWNCINFFSQEINSIDTRTNPIHMI